MKKILVSLLALIFLITLSSYINKRKIKKIKNIYKKNCGGCHGEKLETFINRTWKYGKEKSDIIKLISSGVDDFGMPSYKNALTEKEIKNIARLIASTASKINVQDSLITKVKDIYTFDSVKIKLEPIISEMESPWGFAQLPNGSYLITDRVGNLFLIDQNKTKTIIKNTPKVLAKGQGGLLDIVLHPQYEQNGWIYLSYSKYKTIIENDKEITYTSTAIVRGKIINNEFTNMQEIFEANPYTTTKHHFGSRIIFDNKGHIYISVGERGKHFEFPQKIDNDNGKIHRLNDDGTIPTDNPFYKDTSSKKSIFSYGHRNPQGLFFNTLTNQIWETEHGPKGGDEINILKAGANYGWPVISFGINYDGTSITELTQKDSMEQPIFQWTPSIAPSSMTFVSSDKYPFWKGSLLVGSLSFKYLEQCIINENKVVKTNKLFENIGRVRNITMGSDGFLYIAIEKPGIVYKLVPIQ